LKASTMSRMANWCLPMRLWRRASLTRSSGIRYRSPHPLFDYLLMRSGPPIAPSLPFPYFFSPRPLTSPGPQTALVLRSGSDLEQRRRTPSWSSQRWPQLPGGFAHALNVKSRAAAPNALSLLIGATKTYTQLHFCPPTP
jgi:hypothetical protein